MEVKKTEVRRFITVEFKESDLIGLHDELVSILHCVEKYNQTKYNSPNDKTSTIKIVEFNQVIHDSLSELRKE
jgi:hypothetical protein